MNDLLKQKIFFKLRAPSTPPPQEGTPEFKAWRSNQKAPVEKWAEDKNRYTYADLVDWPNIGMAIPQGYIVIDIDNKMQAAKVHKALIEYGIKCIISNTGNGKHFIFKDPKGKNRSVQSNGAMAIGGLKIDSRIPAYGDKNGGYIAVKFLPDADMLGKPNGERFVQMLDLKELDYIPLWLEPIKEQWNEKAKKIVSNEWISSTRDDSFMGWTTTLWKTDISKKKDLITALSFINDYLMEKPLLRGQQFTKKIDGWVNYAENTKVDRTFQIGKEDQKIEAFGLVEKGTDIDYMNLAKHIKALFNVNYYDGKWWHKKDKPWHEILSDEELYMRFIDKGGNAALKADEKKFLNALKTVSYKDKVDDEKELINFKNGRFNLKKQTLEKYEDNKDLFITFGVDVDYNKDAVSPIVDMTLKQWTQDNQDEIDTLMEFIGSVMYPDNSYSRGLILYGPTAHNGKSTFLKMMSALFKREYISSLNFSQLESKHGASNLIGKRLIQLAELEDTYIERSTVFKQLVGSNDVIEVEEKFKATRTISPKVKFIGATNRFPRFGDQSEGVWRRIVILPFYFKPNKEEMLKFDERKLFTKESKERLIYLATQGLVRYLDKRSFTMPERSKKLEKEMKVNSNPVHAWSLDKSSSQHEAMIAGKELTDNYNAYKHWCQSNSYKALGKNNFKKELERVRTDLFWEQIGNKAAVLKRLKPTKEESDKDLEQIAIDELLK